ncbi:MAG: hypothetical protein HY896_10275 [Deltaproteobacteria bacterium]|nr:hypothetical protein [Deltaproteobacteria bacterium]
MNRKVVFVVFCLFFALAAAVFAADGDDTAPAKNDSAPSGGPSYFEGVWAGKWPGYRSTNLDQDLSITIVKGKREGVFVVTYEFGTVNYMSGPVAGGSFKTRGREEGDKFFFGWTNKQGRKFEVTLQKYKENTVKARIDRLGTITSAERPYTESFLDRK